MSRYPSNDEARRDQAAANRAMFDRIARRYDLLNRLMSLGQDRRWRARLAALTGVGEGSCCLDLACGTGDVMRELTRSGAAVVGIDASAGMLAVARERLGSDARLLRGDALRLPLADEAFDAVTIAFGNRNVADLAALFAEMHRVLKPGGRAATLEISPPASPWFRPLFLHGLSHVPALLARLFGADPAAYRYLPESVRRYPDPHTVAAMMREAGFHHVRVETGVGGAIVWHLGRKQM